MRYAKAIAAAGVAFFGALGTAYADSSITSVEWIGIASVTFGALAIVWGVPNKQP